MSNPRKAAFQTLLRIEKERSYADILIDLELRNGKLEGADRGLFTELVYGVLRRKGTLDYIVSNFSERPLEKLERNVLLLLRLGLYQMFFLDRIPVSAAVNETVNLAKEFAPRASGFINGVLRSADCGRSDIKYPDKKESPAKFLSVAYSHPEWITEEWIKDLGIEEAEKLAKTMSQPPTLTLRVNRLKTNRESLLSTLKEEGVEGVSSEWSPEGIAVTSSISLPQMKSFNDGLFVVQDEASQLAVKLLNPKPSESVLDLCAAPGGKTTYIAQLMDNRGHVLACDIGERKLGKIQDTAQRLGISIIDVMAIDGTGEISNLSGAPFDRIIVDAPCTGLGVIHRNPEGKWWKEKNDSERLSLIQLALLKNAANLLKPGGILLYSTCSTSRTENEQVIHSFLRSNAGFRVERITEIYPELRPFETSEGFFRSWPHKHKMDGFFAARLCRNKV